MYLALYLNTFNSELNFIQREKKLISIATVFSVEIRVFLLFWFCSSDKAWPACTSATSFNICRLSEVRSRLFFCTVESEWVFQFYCFKSHHVWCGSGWAIPENREFKKWKFCFFHQIHALSMSFDIFVVTYRVTNFLPKLVDMLIFSMERTECPFFVFPYFRVLPVGGKSHHLWKRICVWTMCSIPTRNPSI